MPRGIPAAIVDLARRVDAHGGKAWMVGGCVRDRMLGRTPKDFDVEVYGLPEEQLEALLHGLGRVNAVGRSFGVFKVGVGDFEFEVSLPRRDSRVGAGHRGIAVVGDPHMEIVEACRRRDLTINAILEDPLDEGVVEDPFDGIADLAARRLREVDPHTFNEDPLRALRVVQFAARLDFELTETLVELCRISPLDELPAERIRGEIDKLLMARHPGRGVVLLEHLWVRERLFPSLKADPATLERAAAHRDAMSDPGPRHAIMLAALLHGAGDPLGVLERLGVFTLGGYRLRDTVLAMLAEDAARPEALDDRQLRELSDLLPLEIFLRFRESRGLSGALGALERAEALGVAQGRFPELLLGRDLARLGVPAGPLMGRMLQELRKAWQRGEVDPAGAEAWVMERISRGS